MRTFFVSLAACAALSLVAAPSASAQNVKIIVHAGTAVSELPESVVADIFLKKVEKFPGGAAATPVDQPASSATRVAFTKAVLNRAVTAVTQYWQQQIFAGGDLPPAVKASDAEVVAFVKATPGGIGYVSADADVSGVKVVTVK